MLYTFTIYRYVVIAIAYRINNIFDLEFINYSLYYMITDYIVRYLQVALLTKLRRTCAKTDTVS